MKGNQQPIVPNKKLILHFDVEGVLKLPNRKNKDLYVLKCDDIDVRFVLGMGMGETIKK